MKSESLEQQIMSKDKYENIFAPNRGYCVHLSSIIFATRGERVYEKFNVHYE